MLTTTWFSLLLILIITAALILSGVKKQPGLGFLVALPLVGLVLWQRGDGLAALGLRPPESWLRTLGWALLFGILLQGFSLMILEPLVERITRTPFDYRLLDDVRGNWKVFLQWMVVVWIFVALLEEVLFRGFLLGEFTRVLGTGLPGLTLSGLLSSVIFGFSHWYQGPSGAISTGVIGMLLAVIFIGSDFNLWLPIFTHGVIDTVGIALIALEKEHMFRRVLWED
jgi:hypothetical protein